MADDRADLRDADARRAPLWFELFRGFQIALDPKKLLLAAAGLVAMAAGWWLLSWIFYSARTEPRYDSGHYKNWAQFQEDRAQWNLLYEAAGPDATADNGPASNLPAGITTPDDLANNPEEYQQINDEFQKLDRAVLEEVRAGRREIAIPVSTETDGKRITRTVYVRRKPHGKMRTWPWFEDRGPNPYLLVSGGEGNPNEGTGYGPWQRGQFLNWLITQQLPVLIEPVRKLLLPVIFLLKPKIGFINGLYFSLAIIWMLAVWALFGGAITRMAAVQVARREKVGMADAIRFTLAHYLSYFSAPLFPLIFVAVLVVFCGIFGVLHLIPGVGDIIVDGLGWPLPLLAGLVMTVLLVGLVGWPMMYATISAEGSDSFDALSRSYSYVYQNPWHYIWYSLVAIAYGAVLIFFVGFMGSLTVYLAKWGVSQAPGTDYFRRDPSYLFVKAPTSFEWRQLLLQGAVTADGRRVVLPEGGISEPAYQTYLSEMRWYNWVGAALVTLWLALLFLFVVGFGYSYFWCASTIIYLLMRRNVDDTELDEVYLEEDEAEDLYGAPAAAPPSPAAPTTTPLTVVEGPASKTATVPSAPDAAPEPRSGDVHPPA